MGDGPDYGYGEARAMAESEEHPETFALEIKLGNAAMQTPDQVAWALRKVADRLSNRGDFDGPEDGVIQDLNGQTVGSWAARQ